MGRGKPSQSRGMERQSQLVIGCTHEREAKKSEKDAYMQLPKTCAPSSSISE